jgi:hypothetical protein
VSALDQSGVDETVQLVLGEPDLVNGCDAMNTGGASDLAHRCGSGHVPSRGSTWSSEKRVSREMDRVAAGE